MKNLSFILIAFFAIGIFTACDEEIEVELLTCEQQTIIDASQYQTATSDAASIDSLEITGNCLSITFSSGGCDGETWQVKLIDSGSVAESLPPQRSLKLTLENEEVCLAQITKTISFDVHELEVDGEVSVWLNISDSDDESEQILYEF